MEQKSSFPSRLAFDKYKGRFFREALSDAAFMKWLQNLSQSPILSSVAIGNWYLNELQCVDRRDGVQLFEGLELNELRASIEESREKIAELDSIYTQEHQAVECIRARLFLLLRPTYEKLDALRIQVDYRRRFLEAFLQGHSDQAEIIAEEEQYAQSSNHQAYEEAGQSASNKPALDEQESAELRAIYRKLAALYHPDKYVNDPESQDSFIGLMKQINQAKDAGDINILRDIAENPNQFLERTGHHSLDLGDSSEFDSLQLLYISLQERIGELQKQLHELRTSTDYELWKLCEQDPGFLDIIAEEQIRDLEEEVRKLEDECSVLADEINQNLNPDSPLRI